MRAMPPQEPLQRGTIGCEQPIPERASLGFHAPLQPVIKASTNVRVLRRRLGYRSIRKYGRSRHHRASGPTLTPLPVNPDDSARMIIGTGTAGPFDWPGPVKYAALAIYTVEPPVMPSRTRNGKISPADRITNRGNLALLAPPERPRQAVATNTERAAAQFCFDSSGVRVRGPRLQVGDLKRVLEVNAGIPETARSGQSCHLLPVQIICLYRVLVWRASVVLVRMSDTADAHVAPTDALLWLLNDKRTFAEPASTSAVGRRHAFVQS